MKSFDSGEEFCVFLDLIHQWFHHYWHLIKFQGFHAGIWSDLLSDFIGSYKGGEVEYNSHEEVAWLSTESSQEKHRHKN